MAVNGGFRPLAGLMFRNTARRFAAWAHCSIGFRPLAGLMFRNRIQRIDELSSTRLRRFRPLAGLMFRNLKEETV